MLGTSLLVATVVEQGRTSREVYLPDNRDARGRGCWWDWLAGTSHEGGETVVVDAPLSVAPVFAAAGSMVPLAEPSARAAIDGGFLRWLRVFPWPWDGAHRTFRFEWREDDGLSRGEAAGGESALMIECKLGGYASSLTLLVDLVQISPDRPFVPAFREVVVLLPAAETRPLAIQVQTGGATAISFVDGGRVGHGGGAVGRGRKRRAGAEASAATSPSLWGLPPGAWE